MGIGPCPNMTLVAWFIVSKGDTVASSGENRDKTFSLPCSRGPNRMSTQPHPLARVVLFTADACLTADLATAGERVQDALNASSAILELSRLTYSNPDRPGIPIVEYAAGAIRKSDVGCVVVLSEPPQTTMKKIGTFVQKRPVRVSILTPGMVVVGTVHVQGRFDPNVLLQEGFDTFMPLTEAGVVRARTTTPTSVPPERLTVFVNRAHISGVLLAEPDTEIAAPVQHAPERLQPPVRYDSGLQTGGNYPAGVQAPSHTGRLRRLSTTDSDW